MMKKVCLFSGGMDSSTLAYHGKIIRYETPTFHANYGQHTQRNERACGTGSCHFRCNEFAALMQNDPIPYEVD
jgi:tRNA U34 2-thiouridine synthase MnmA/TrmU